MNPNFRLARACGLSPRSFLAAILLVSGLIPALPARAADSLDVTKYGVVWRVPAMDKVEVRKELDFGDGEQRFDLYLPPAGTAARRSPLPILVFVNATGARFQDWEIYRDWGRLAAAHGMAGIVYQSDPGNGMRSLSRITEHVRAHARELGVDAARLAIWACSANVSLALPWMHSEPRPALSAAVLFYGSMPVRELRTDLPVYYVLAGRDSPNLKDGAKTLFAQAIAASAPWTMVEEPGLTHAFDALDQGVESQRAVKRTVDWLVDQIVAPPVAGPAPSPAREAVTRTYGQEWPQAEAALRARLGDKTLPATDIRSTHAALGSVLARSGQSAAAVPEIRMALEGKLGAEEAGLRVNLGQALIATGDETAGLAEIARGVAAGANGAFAYGRLGLPAMNQGDFKAAIRLWGAGLTLDPPLAPEVRRTLAYNIACAHARAGETDSALASLEQAIDLGFTGRTAIANDTDFAAIANDPRFKALLETVRTD
ncbi:MAG: hypothetical protein ABI639_03795 [Thermoanaerobaculia bacterium]